jgi:hypothetical protein
MSQEFPMSQPQPQRRQRPVVNAGRLWGGGLATAAVAALIGYVGGLVCDNVLDIPLATPAAQLGRTSSSGFGYPATAFILALAATALAHLLVLFAPQPQKFFRWIVGLFTLAGVVAPFGLDIGTDRRVATAVVNLVLGLAIGSLVSAVAASSTTVVAEEPH